MIVKVLLNEGAQAPKQATANAAGFDLFSTEAFVLEPGARYRVRTGVSLEIPPGFEGQVRSRSGLASEFGVVVLNSPGTVDADYRGEVQVLLWNTSGKQWACGKNQRIAQLVFSQLPEVELEEVVSLGETLRGSGGFGSSGK